MSKKKYQTVYAANFRDWDKIVSLTDFSFPWSPDTSPPTSFKACHNNEFLFFQFEAMGAYPKVYVKNNLKTEVLPSERVEIFLRKNPDMNPYYCLEMDALGRVLDYKAKFYRQFDYRWNWPDPLFIRTEIKEDRYQLQGRLRLSTLTEMGLLNNDRLEIGLFRAYCTSMEGSKSTLEWISWVNPNTPEPDFHQPGTFGQLILK